MAAGKVALMESEYTKLKSGIVGVHEDCLSQIETVVSSLQGLNEKGGGFYADHLSQKINALIEELNSIKGNMQSLYVASEEIVESFQMVVDDYDTLD